MRKIGVIPNSERDNGLVLTKQVVEWLIEKGHAPLVAEQVGSKIDRPACIADMQAIYAEAEFLVVLGGDGTILRVARNAALHDIPLIGVNLGTLGYLTDVEANGAQFIQALSKALDGQYKIEKRMMLEAHILTEGTGNETHIALNDVCISRGVFSSMITMELFINDEFIDRYRADGFIVSTPTGSTAYNLSAGGPILKPDAEMIAITPICPHMMYARTLVVSAGDVVKIKLNDTANADGIIALDGQNHGPLVPGDAVTVRRSNYYTSIMKTNDNSFFDILRHKMMRSTPV